MIAVREFTSAAECIAHAQAVHRKFFAKPSEKRPVLVPAPIFHVQPETPLYARPVWKRADTHFDDHVKLWEYHLMVRYAHPVRQFILKRCDEVNIPYQVMTSKTRVNAVVVPRQELMLDLRDIFKISLPEIGRRLGGFDHTTVLHGIRKATARRALQPKEGE